MNIKYIIRI